MLTWMHHAPLAAAPKRPRLPGLRAILRNSALVLGPGIGAALFIAGGCGGPRPPAPLPVLDVEALLAHVQPTDEHPAVLVNVWASW